MAYVDRGLVLKAGWDLREVSSNCPHFASICAFGLTLLLSFYFTCCQCAFSLVSFLAKLAVTVRGQIFNSNFNS